MRSEGYSSRSVCVCVCLSTLILYSATIGHEAAYQRYIPTAAELRKPENQKSDFAEMTAFESEKLARSRTEFRGPTHQ